MLQRAKELNISCQNSMKAKDFHQVINEAQYKHKEILFGSDSVTCFRCLNKL